MGYNSPGKVKMLKIAPKPGESPVEPSTENVKNGTYPITRPLLCYTAGDPEGALKDYLEWSKGDAAQAIVGKQGYVSIK